MNRIGVIGGSFNPVHYGHLRLAEEAKEALELDRVLFVPAYVSPFKQSTESATAEHRLKMLELAIAQNSSFELSAIEIEREGASYTVDTLRSLHALRPQSKLYFLIGSDAASRLHEWHEADALLWLAEFVVGIRPGTTMKRMLKAMVPPFSSKITILKMLPMDLSSSEVREKIASGGSVRYLTPDPVVQYIAKHELYKDYLPETTGAENEE